jgi:hypothetical protein
MVSVAALREVLAEMWPEEKGKRDSSQIACRWLGDSVEVEVEVEVEERRVQKGQRVAKNQRLTITKKNEAV